MTDLLALDLGTTSVRALVVRPGEGVTARAQRPLSTRFPAPGRVEQDPDEWWSASLDVLREAIARAGTSPDRLAGLGVVTQRATVVAWDAATGRPLAPAIGWQDQRTAERVAGLRAAGIPLTTLASITKLEWWMCHEPAVQQAARDGRLRLGTPDAWLGWCLTAGQAHVTDPGHASCTALFDPAHGDWADPLCEMFGVPREALPRIEPTAGVVGETAALGGAVPVAARAGDQQASAFAQGVHAPGDAKLTLGTSAMLDLHTGEAPPELRDGAYPLVLWELERGRRTFCLEATVVTAGAAVDWLVDLGIARDAAEVSALAASVPSSEGVWVVPALQGLGSPWLDDSARGVVLGLTRGSDRARLARGLLEGLAHRAVDLIDALGLDDRPLLLDGGLAQSEVLVQRLADLSQRVLLRAAEVEATALGAALLAGLARGVFASPEACRAVAGAPERYEPAVEPSVALAERARWSQAVAVARDTAPGSA